MEESGPIRLNYSNFDWFGCCRHLIHSDCNNLAHFNSGSAGNKKLLAFSFKESKPDLKNIDQTISTGRFGIISYDCKNRFFNISSKNTDKFGWDDFLFFDADLLVQFEHHHLIISGDQALFQKYIIPYINIPPTSPDLSVKGIDLRPDTSKKDYLQNVLSIKEHLQYGNIYEMNYCIDFNAEKKIDPLINAWKLFKVTDAPFSGFIKIGHKWVISGSPERFIKKSGNQLISQPIKGTARRGKDPEEDQMIKDQLANDDKERSENVMIVDLVRNDLSRIAKMNSVQVDELFGVYTFKTVHQLVSTVSCKIKENIQLYDILKATFPMGSMTGAPKLSALNLIEQHENFKRGAYSGAMGYILPNGDFDFNVVIRSLIYDAADNIISAPVGGAITIGSDPEAEYNECLLKLAGIQKSLS